MLRQTSPSFTFILGNKSNFKQDEMEDLFGRSFVKEMVKSADTVKKLANMGWSGLLDHAGGINRSVEKHYHGGYTAGKVKHLVATPVIEARIMAAAAMAL